jgi:hypothetical protein
MKRLTLYTVFLPKKRCMKSIRHPFFLKCLVSQKPPLNKVVDFDLQNR